MILDILNSDLIEKILKIRTDDIERSIMILERKIKQVSKDTNKLKIYNIEEDSVVVYSNDRYFISIGRIFYCCPFYLFDSIVNANCIFIYSYFKNNKMISTFSKIYKNPTMAMLCSFTSKTKYYWDTRNKAYGYHPIHENNYELHNIKKTKTDKNEKIYYLVLGLDY